jgi:hypothetical protein
MTVGCTVVLNVLAPVPVTVYAMTHELGAVGTNVSCRRTLTSPLQYVTDDGVKLPAHDVDGVTVTQVPGYAGTRVVMSEMGTGRLTYTSDAGIVAEIFSRARTSMMRVLGSVKRLIQYVAAAGDPCSTRATLLDGIRPVKVNVSDAGPLLVRSERAETRRGGFRNDWLHDKLSVKPGGRRWSSDTVLDNVLST